MRIFFISILFSHYFNDFSSFKATRNKTDYCKMEPLKTAGEDEDEDEDEHDDVELVVRETFFNLYLLRSLSLHLNSLFLCIFAQSLTN